MRRDRHSERVDPKALLRIRDLSLRARVVVEGFASGLHRSPAHGFSAEFSEYREYTPGDDLRYLDWRVLARTDRRYLKRFEDETNLRCHLVVDRSRSMTYGIKRDYAITLAATFATFLRNQRDAVGVVTFDEKVTEFVPARYRVGGLPRLLAALERPSEGTNTDLAAPLADVARTVRKRGWVVLISDLLAPLEKLETPLAALRARGHEVMILRVLDPREQTLDLGQPAVLTDLESGVEMYIDAELAGPAYREKFREHEMQLESISQGLGIDFVTMTTERPLELALAEFIEVRSRRGRAVQRAAARRA